VTFQSPIVWCVQSRTDGICVFPTAERARHIVRQWQTALGVAGASYQGHIPGAARFRNGSTLAFLVDGPDVLRGLRYDWVVYPTDEHYIFDVAFAQVSPPRSGGVRPGYVSFPKGNGTYHAKEHLKALGGRWDATAKVWLVPEEHEEEARRLIREAEAGRIRADDTPSLHSDVGVITCWECGNRVYVREVVTRGGDATHFYCGCGEPPKLPQAQPARRPPMWR
jgi:hypothetical protein